MRLVSATRAQLTITRVRQGRGWTARIASLDIAPAWPSGEAADRGAPAMDFAATIGMVETQTPLQIILLRLLIAAVLGGAIGYEREANAPSAGLRTHILIAVAAMLFTSLAFEIFHMDDVSGSANADPIRAIEAVTAGIAFLGAGAIFRAGAGVHGLTTGAGMWLAGAVGVATALGYYVIALAATVLAVLVLAALRVFAHRIIGHHDDTT